MFRCSGYIPAFEFAKIFVEPRLPERLRSVIWEQARRRAALDLLKEERGSSPDYTEEDIQSRIGLLSRGEEPDLGRLNFYALKSVLRTTPLYLCGPDEHVIKVGREILSGNGRYISPREEGRPFDLLSRDFLTVDVSELAELVDALDVVRRSQLLPMKTLMHRRASEFLSYKPLVHNLLPLQGYALSMKRDQLPATDDDILAHFGIFKKASVISEKRIGRPRKQEQALEAYRDKFPTGDHGRYTWKEVLRILDVEYDVKVSEDTLREALRSPEEGDELDDIMPEKSE